MNTKQEEGEERTTEWIRLMFMIGDAKGIEQKANLDENE